MDLGSAALFTAALKLLRFAIGIETVCGENEEQKALRTALLPLLQLEDGHVLATLSAIVLAQCEGRTGLAISGVFGAGKTRSAAALLAGLLVFDPQGKMGRLVGYYEQNRKGSYTPLDILPSNRNQVIRRSHSSLDAEVAFNRNAVSNLAPWLTG